MTKKSLVLGVVALCALPMAGYAQTTTLLSENFDELTPMLDAMDVGAFHTINGTNVDIIGGSLFGDLCRPPATMNCVDMNGTNAENPQGVLQSKMSFTLRPGFDYSLSFVMNGDPAGTTDTSTTVDFGPLTKTLDLAPGSTGRSTFSDITVASQMTTFLTFTSNQPGNIGSILDDVVVTSSPISAAPEPATLGLMVLGLLAAGIAGRKRQT